MISTVAWQTLISKKLFGKGSLVGITTPATTKVYQRFVVEQVFSSPDIKIKALHIQSNKTLFLDISTIAEIDGMNIQRFLGQADLDTNGVSTTSGKKRGRRPKHKPLGE